MPAPWAAVKRWTIDRGASPSAASALDSRHFVSGRLLPPVPESSDSLHRITYEIC